MKRVIIMQARMTSTRLPGKVLKDLMGRPMLACQIERLRPCQCVDELMIATTTNTTDDPVIELCEAENIPWFRGSENDVLSRYVGAARQAGADVIIRITSDCPLIDSEVVDKVIRELTDNAPDCDYASNVIERSYPRGLDTEAFLRETLERCDRLAVSDQSREHVTSVIREVNPDEFICRSVTDSQDNSDLRWTVDTEADLKLVRRIYEELNLPEKQLSYPEIVAYVRSHPELAKINEGIETWDPIEGGGEK